MRKTQKILLIFTLALAFTGLFAVPAFAVTEAEVQQQVNAIGKEGVTGNIFIWFLCAIGFLKVSQKIDSFMSSLGINVGHTGGSMLAEAMIAARGVASVKSLSGGHGGGGPKGGAPSGGVMGGGLAGVVGRSFQNGAVKSATGSGGGGLGGKAFASSMSKGGGFANRVIGTVATGNISTTGTMTGEKASAALSSYLGEDAEDVPAFSNVEIGGGRIMATETSAEYPEGVAIGMYHADQYMAPSGEYSMVTAADGTTWYKQYAADAVERKPYKAPDGNIAYNESIVKKLPDPPKRKDKI